MRLDARKGDANWMVWHVTECRCVKYCVWIDDETAQWGKLSGIRGGFEWGVITHQEKRIAIYPDRRLVLINPVADSEPERIVEEATA